MSLLEYIQSHLRAFNPMALPVLIGTTAITLILALISGELAVIGIVLIIVMLIIYGDPPRAVPTAAGIVVAPVDGMITGMASNQGLPLLFDRANDQSEHFTRFSFRQRTLGSRALRAPVDGTVVEIIPHATTSQEAAKSMLEQVEQTLVLIRDDQGQEFALDLRAPIIPKQIWLNISTGVRIAAGERIGMIAVFGFMDLYVPDQKILYKATGQRTLAGETVMAVASGPSPSFRLT